jgi:hypothetical protein
MEDFILCVIIMAILQGYNYLYVSNKLSHQPKLGLQLTNTSDTIQTFLSLII